MSIKAIRTGIVLQPDPTRVLFRPFDLGSTTRTLKIVARVGSMTDEEAAQNSMKSYGSLADATTSSNVFY